MKRTPWIALVLILLAGMLPAQTFMDASTSASLRNASMTIQSELQSHGARVLGKDLYSWHTRLDKVQGCRVEFSVRVESNLTNPSVNVQTVSFSLGALNPYGISFQQHWLKIPCMEENCIYSTTRCTRKSADGVVIDCSTPNQTWAHAFALEMDGNEASALRLQKAFYQAVESCRRPARVSF